VALTNHIKLAPEVEERVELYFYSPPGFQGLFLGENSKVNVIKMLKFEEGIKAKF
jgi:hypothetical protein